MIYLCITTVGAAEAPTLARQLVEERLAACVNIIPAVRSIYRWEGQVRDEEEALLFIKTSPRTLGGFEERFRKMYPYECPELLIVPIEEGLKEYLHWVEEMTIPVRRSADDQGAAP